MNDYPAVSVWEPRGNEFALVGQVLAYRSLQFEKRYLEAGPWQLDVEYDEVALSLQPHRLVSIDWRGQTMAGALETFKPGIDLETGQPVLSVGGKSALSVLGRVLTWPDPTSGLGSQPNPAPRLDDDAETVVRTMIEGNYVDRAGGQLATGPNRHLGSQVKARPVFDNLLEIVAKKAKRGGIAVDVVLERTTSTRARLALEIREPEDKTRRVRLTQAAGTLREWQQDSAAPSVTHALVGGAGEGTDRVFRQVSTNKSRNSAQTWGGARESFVDGPSSFDNPELDQAGEEALDEGAETLSLTLTAAESEGLRAFRDYDVGDRASASLVSGVEVEDVISSIGVRADDSGIDVTPGFGDPDSKSPALKLGQMIRGQNRRIRALERK